MRIWILTFLMASFTTAFSQTCAGIIKVKVMEPKTFELIADNLKVSISYVYTTPEEEWYDVVNEVVPYDSLTKADGYTIHTDQGQYNLMKWNEPVLAFPGHCGGYLVQLEMQQNKETMRLGIYNIPANQYFELDSVLFKPGDYYVDLQASQLLDQFDFQEGGFFRVSPSYIQPFEAKEEEQEETR